MKACQRRNSITTDQTNPHSTLDTIKMKHIKKDGINSISKEDSPNRWHTSINYKHCSIHPSEHNVHCRYITKVTMKLYNAMLSEASWETLIQFQGCYDRTIVHCSWWAWVLYPAWWYRGWQSIHLTVPPIYLIVPHLTVCNTSNVTKMQLWDILRPIFVYNFLTQLSQTKEKTELIDFTHSLKI